MLSVPPKKMLHNFFGGWKYSQKSSIYCTLLSLKTYPSPQTSFLNVSEWAWARCDRFRWSLFQPQPSSLLSLFFGTMYLEIMNLETTASEVNFYLNLNNVDVPEVSNELHVGNKHCMNCECSPVSLSIKRPLWMLELLFVFVFFWSGHVSSLLWWNVSKDTSFMVALYCQHCQQSCR